MGDQKSYKTSLLNKASIAYDYLHTNSTTHEFVFGAIAELVDNSFDAGSSSLSIDYDPQIQALSFLDDGCGMTRDEVISVVSFGHSVKKADPNTVGQYGNGLKSGSMRIGKDFILFTKKKELRTCLFLSRTFHEGNNLKEVFVPTPSFVEGDSAYLEDQVADRERHSTEMDIIFEYSPFKDAGTFFAQFDRIKGSNGTLILCYNLRQLDLCIPELDFTSDIYDIRLSKNAEQREEERNSLRAYLSVLYAKPRMKVYLRDKKVATTNLLYTLSQARMYKYMATNLKTCAKKAYEQCVIATKQLEERVNLAKSDLSVYSKEKWGNLNDKETRIRLNMIRSRVDELTEELKRCKDREQEAAKAKNNPKPLTFFFGLNVHHRNRYGLMVYNNGRLIDMYMKLSIQRERHDQHMKCLGVIGIVDVPCTVLAPTHNKQGFENRTEYLSLLRVANEHMEQYWFDVQLISNQGGPAGFWSQYGYKSTAWESPRDTLFNVINGIPSDWICQNNPNSTYQSCSKLEELPKIREGRLTKETPKEKEKKEEKKEEKVTPAPTPAKPAAKVTPLGRDSIATSRGSSTRGSLSTKRPYVSESEEASSDEESEDDKPLRRNLPARNSKQPISTVSPRRAAAKSPPRASLRSPPKRNHVPPTRTRGRASRAKSEDEDESEEDEEEEEDYRPVNKVARTVASVRAQEARSVNSSTSASSPSATDGKQATEIKQMKERGDRAIAFIRSIFGALEKNSNDSTTNKMQDAPENKLLAVNATEIIQRVIVENVDKAIESKEETHRVELQKQALDSEQQLMNGKNPVTRKIRAAALTVVNWGAQEDPEFADITMDNALQKLITFAESVSDINVETAGLENGEETA
ncbi:unnamed protein product, partial [Mesorhabditis belari]|uniref:Morc S5 domain-containing protein n=1 Tax=Mesorhabditis belari TaxID=2138241 RepID=A0AAF3F538_9BILA